MYKIICIGRPAWEHGVESYPGFLEYSTKT